LSSIGLRQNQHNVSGSSIVIPLLNDDPLAHRPEFGNGRKIILDREAQLVSRYQKHIIPSVENREANSDEV